MRKNLFKSEEYRKGFLAALAAFFLWGNLPLFWWLLHGVSATEILCHRVVWSFLFILAALLLRGELGTALRIGKNPKALLLLTLSCALLMTNWFIYIWAISRGMVLETSLGYYINPLFTILAGILFFRDKGTPALWVALALCAFGVSFQVMVLGHVPLVALTLAFSFAGYSIIRKIIVVESLPGLFVETAISVMPCLLWLVCNASQGESHFGTAYPFWSALLVISGIATTLPLFLFTFGARKIPFSLVGVLQYTAPSVTFLLGIFVFKEDFDIWRFVTFACIWSALAIYTVDSLRRLRARDS
jgi:rarD protein